MIGEHITYVDGFVLPVPKNKVAACKRLSATAGKIWREHGALEYRECVGDDLKVKMGVAFSKLAKSRPNETVVFSYIVYKLRAHRDKVLAKVMSDKRITGHDGKAMPFDPKRMALGGFKTIVDV